MRPTPEPAAPGQESVWAYPRPAIAQPTTNHILILHRGETLADTRRAVRTLETSHPPTWYLPPADVATAHLTPSAAHSFCEWKGHARYFDVTIGGERIADAAWSYPNPTPGFACLRNHIAFYTAPFTGCFVDGERVTPQPGGFYGGWITAALAGPFKGIPGSRFW